ncbi:MAG: PCRF domain-containing protein [Clostridia bacterium]|nr:PCRF domain-containing protein [Clostridia bacterium]
MEKIDKTFMVKFNEKEKEYDEIGELLESVEIMMDNKLFLYYQKKYKSLEKIVTLFKEFKKLKLEIEDNEELLTIEESSEIKNQLIIQNKSLSEKSNILFNQMKNELVKSDEKLNQKIKIEITLKTGDSEKFANIINLFSLYAKMNNCEFVVINQNENNTLIEIIGDNIYDDLNIFSGNVKMITAGNETVFGVVILNIKDNNFKLSTDDVEIETLKSDGAGGQHINKTESGIRLIHKPTGIVVVCKDERSQVMNKKRAFENLEKKILEKISKDSKNDIEIQRKNIKNALFSSTPTIIFNYDRNIVVCQKTKKEYNLKQILNGDLKIISSDIIVNGK